VTKKVDGKVHEPVEDLTIDVPEEFLGPITQLMAARKGRMTNMVNNNTGWTRMEFLVPSRGLIGFRTEFLTITKGTGIANAISAGYDAWFGEIVTRNNGSMVADRAGVVTPFAMIGLQERGSFFVEPTSEVYAGMVVGENELTTWKLTSPKRRSSPTCAPLLPTSSSHLRLRASCRSKNVLNSPVKTSVLR
jgi:GTP-binding protein